MGLGVEVLVDVDERVATGLMISAVRVALLLRCVAIIAVCVCFAYGVALKKTCFWSAVTVFLV